MQSQPRELSPVGATLDLDGRLACQRAVEEVFWRHRIWPAENPTPKPSLDAVLPAGVLRARAEEGARKSNALDTLAGQSITGQMLQREMERMARETRQPEVLRELWTALGNDPTLIAECVARPALTDRLLTAWHARAEEASAEPFAAWWQQNVASYDATLKPPTFDYELPEITASREGGTEGTWVPTPAMPERTNGSSVWTGTEMIVWGGGGLNTGRSNEGGRYNPATDSWYPTNTPLAPAGRYDHSAVWTGTEMIVWGGCGSSTFAFCELRSGGRYNPLTDSWIPVAETNAPDARIRHTAVWTGSEMIVWGGCAPQSSPQICATKNTGGRYAPATDSWSPTTLAGAPSARVYHTAVWDGEEMIVWGGENESATTATGGRYDPATDSWTATSTVGAPEPRRSHTAVWTGSEMIVWGGCGVIQGCLVQGTALGTGARYDPATDSWSAVTTTGAPSPRVGHRAVWTGSEMIVWGGGTSNNIYYRSGGRYDPATDSWTPTSTSGAPSARAYHQYAWTGSEMIVWGGSDRTGGRYNPQTDSWSPTSTEDPNSRRALHTAVWTGSEMIVWGGDDVPTGTTRTGRIYNPTLRTWRETSMVNVPWQREFHTAVWTGTEMIVWGGRAGSTGFNDGGRYNPTSDSWAPTSTVNAPAKRVNHTAVWTGSEMIIWGGLWDLPAENTGGRYNPSTDTWTPTSTTGAPQGRDYHTAVWTGSEMIVWGGQDAGVNGGGRYNPSTNSWTPMATTGEPTAGALYEAVWTGNEMIVWGGWYNVELGSGGRYNPATNSWAPTTNVGAPSGRVWHTAVWTGAEMIIAGGLTPVWGTALTGGRYNPVSDSWVPLPSDGAPYRREKHSAVWTGNAMIVWGGSDNSYMSSGAEYHVDAPDNQAPLALPDSYSVVQGATLTVPLPGVLANDSDADGNALSAALVAGPTHGALTLKTDGGFTYIPHAGYAGPDSFTYRAYDGLLYSNVVTVGVTVQSIPSSQLFLPLILR